MRHPKILVGWTLEIWETVSIFKPGLTPSFRNVHDFILWINLGAK
jgi:hypothetical protein